MLIEISYLVVLKICQCYVTKCSPAFEIQGFGGTGRRWTASQLKHPHNIHHWEPSRARNHDISVPLVLKLLAQGGE